VEEAYDFPEMSTVLLIDDSDLDRKIAADALTYGGFTVEQASDGRTGLRQVFECRPDIIVLDVMMPSLDGWAVCERIREVCDTPIIMLTSLDREEDMIRGLDLGADDFVSKPVSPNHLLARIRAVLRRTGGSKADSVFIYDDGTLSVDASNHQVRLDGEPVELTPTEFRLLLTLARTPDRVHTYAELLTEIWGQEYVDDLEFLRVYVWRLRKKLGADSDNPRWIATERGFGYRFVAAPEAGRR
jgi:two-component system KDP operon response regulator KdpE